MKSVWKLLCLLLSFIVLVAVMFFALTVPFISQEVLRPVLSVVVLLLVGCAVRGSIDAIFTKRHTTATGYG